MTLTNWEICVYALFLEGGASKPVHTEDVARCCFELAPDSFSWIKYREYPDKDIVRVALTDARKEKVGALVTGRTGRGRGHTHGKHNSRLPDGWELTEKGAIWVNENRERIETSFAGRRAKSHRLSPVLARLRKNSIFADFLSLGADFQPSIGDLGDCFRCRVDADMAIWDKRFSKLRNEAQAAGEQEILDFLEASARTVTKESEK